eukprot:2133936-Prymnesium_polylepis.1
MNWFRPVVSFDVDDRESTTLCDDVIAKIRTELSSIGDREILLDSNAARADVGVAEATDAAPSETEPLAAFASGVAADDDDDDDDAAAEHRWLLTALLGETGVEASRAEALAAEVPSMLVCEALAVAQSLADCTPAAAAAL